MGEEKCEEAEVDCAGFEPVSCQLQKPESPNLGSWFELSIAERQTKKEDFTGKMTEYAKTMAMCMCCSPKTSTPTSIETGHEEEIEEEDEDAVKEEVDEEVEEEIEDKAEEEVEEVELDIRAKTLGEEKAIPVEMMAQSEESAQKPALYTQGEKTETPAEPLGEDSTSPASQVTLSTALVVSVIIGLTFI